ncbi:MAG: hypothetical protein RBS84_05445 [Kiritimatiellia bacterium]|jgi:hypothetical protein|nr:hypothetical protein [Kiritimatiellia bacterium]
MKKTIITIMITFIGLSISYGAVEYGATARIQFPIELLPTNINMVQTYLANQKLIIISSDNILSARELMGDQADRIKEEITSISTRTVDVSSTIEVQCKATGPVICSSFANALAEAYINWHHNTLTNLNTHPVIIQKAIPAGPPKSTIERMFKSVF